MKDQYSNSENRHEVTNAINDTLSIAANALLSLTHRLDDEFARAIEILRDRTRFVITTGVGKSGHIAQKLAATLTSTGTPTTFLDPLNALHGDLGIVAEGDVVIAFSNSGESHEIVALTPTLKQRNVPIIAITGRAPSTLSELAKVTLVGAIEKEACPLNLAPTTSTTVAITLGDALAVGLMIAGNYKPTDFALNHPAGSLGRKLTLRVRDIVDGGIMPETASVEESFFDVVCKISSSGTGAVCVTDCDDSILGIVTDGDIRRTVQSNPPDRLTHLTAETIMTRNPVSAHLDMLAKDAMNIMEQRSSQISVLPITDDDNTYHGIIRLHDLIIAGI